MRECLPDNLKEIIVLRKLTSDDTERMFCYFNSLGEATRAFFHPHPFDRESAERICADANSDVFRVVAVFEDRIVGYAWFGPQKDSPLSAVGIGISDDFQGKRLGGALMDVLANEARARKIPGLKLTVYKNNERGIKLYSSRGYKVVGELGPQHIMELELD